MVGLSYGQIAAELFVTKSTVGFHLSNIGLHAVAVALHAPRRAS